MFFSQSTNTDDTKGCMSAPGVHYTTFLDGSDWVHDGMVQGYCPRALPKRLQDLLQAGNDDPQIFTKLASCINTTNEWDPINYECLTPLQESHGVSTYDAFLVKWIMNGTNEQITEAKLIAGFSNPKVMKEYDKKIDDPYKSYPYENYLAALVAKTILVLDGLVRIEIFIRIAVKQTSLLF